MSIVTLYGTVPVAVKYDTEERRVTRVVVIDESHEWNNSPGAYDEDEQPLTNIQASHFQHLADLAEWPSWEFGW